MRLEGNGFALVPEHPRYAPAWDRAFAEDPHLLVDWGMSDEMTVEFATGALQDHAALWDNGDGRHFAIVGPDDEFLGGVNFHSVREDHDRAEIGFWLAPWARRRGIGSSAVRMACEWGFERWSLHRIEMQTFPDNPGSLALAAKLGFTREGVLRQRNLERGQYVDLVILGVLRGELR